MNKARSKVERRGYHALRGRINFDRFLEERKGITHEQLMKLPNADQHKIRAEYASAGLQWHAQCGKKSA